MDLPHTVLIVDDERNIRLTLTTALESSGMAVDTAAAGEEALQKLALKAYAVILLDLRLPGMDGLEVLRQVADRYPEVKVIMITAYGTVDAAVEAMKLGAVDFLQKPFNPSEIREVVNRVLSASTALELGQAYDNYVALARQRVMTKAFDAAQVYAHKAIAVNPRRPEAFNLLGALSEVRGNRMEADKNYRVALELSPTYSPARQNLERVTSRPYNQLGIVWG